MDMVIIFLIVTFLFLLSGFPVAFILSGVSLLFAFIGIIFNFFDYSFFSYCHDFYIDFIL